jgi:hypothetical protein
MRVFRFFDVWFQYNTIKNSFSYWLFRHRYYYDNTKNFYQSYVAPQSSIVHVQGKDGFLLERLKPKKGICIDDHESIIQGQLKYNAFEFYESLRMVSDQQIDYIILSFATMEAEDIQMLFQSLQRFCTPSSRIILETYTLWWAPLLWLAQKLKLKRPMRYKNWLARSDIVNIAQLADFEMVTSGGYILIPFYIPIISWVVNDFIAHLPLINSLCLNQWMVLRPKPQLAAHHSVTILIPCRNEKGNVEQAVLRAPQLGLSTEIIFVEGNSSDGTLDEIKRVAAEYPDKNIRCYVQESKGKGDAVRKGFAHATGDILMILDGDLTMPPEELPKFYDAIISGKGDFINGSRLVYGMESGEMSFMGWVSNKFFARLVSWIMGQSVKDTLCGTKVLWKKDYDIIIAQREKLGLADPFGDFDLLFGAAKLNLKIIDIPIHYMRRTYGKTAIRKYKEVWFLLWMCWRAFDVLKRKNNAKN